MKYEIKFSPCTTAYNYEVQANNAVEAEEIARELLEDDAGFGASKAWNCTIQAHIEDQERKFDPPLTDEDYRQILNRIGMYHSPNAGVNWEIIDIYLASHIHKTNRKEKKNEA